MAFLGKVGNILRQSASKQANTEFSATKSFIYQTIRCMSSSKVFVGGLSWGTDQQGLSEAFAKYGEVIEARVIMDRETGRSRGFGFVTYTSSEEASSAIQALDGQELHGRMIRVNYANDRQPPRFSSGYGGGNYGYGGGEGGGYSGGGGGYGGGNYGGGSYGGGGNYTGGGGGGYGSGTGYANDGAGGGYGSGTGYANDGAGGGYGSGTGHANDSAGGGYGSGTGYANDGAGGVAYGSGGNYPVAGGSGGGNNGNYYGTGGEGSFSSAGYGADAGGFGGGVDQVDSSQGDGMGSANGGLGDNDPLEGNSRDEDDEPNNDYAKRA
ncbi:glycine-rich RNA-binding protein 7-like isoform X1 [Rhodamnia argentea]|uniref:Glycine-rich RNA-binding protein 7-like isoform X1 n=1 Tax=Rhodamnia argentea TaxID=178133 RepID=A0A8B8PRV0_9MYRT|nr:glycine-rich RNA-binding protein 7-like isoform X1 [Rhodamnia argentea]